MAKILTEEIIPELKDKLPFKHVKYGYSTIPSSTGGWSTTDIEIEGFNDVPMAFAQFINSGSAPQPISYIQFQSTKDKVRFGTYGGSREAVGFVYFIFE